MDQVLNAENVVFAKVLLDDLVVGEGNTLLVDLAVSALVDQFTDGLEVGLTSEASLASVPKIVANRLPVCDVGLNKSEHLLGSAGGLDEHTIVDLEEAEELQDFSGFWCDLVDTRGI